MDISLEPGKYIVAVSGGIDSVCLLHLIASSRRLQTECEFAVAHFDHGIRPDSRLDEQFVRKLAKSYGFEYVTTREELGSTASEAVARERRYNFLNQVKEQKGVKAIITAHHADDAIETALINLIRGTGRRGLASLRSGTIVRPLLQYSKSQITDYAIAHKLEWREDSTNHEDKYLRNKLRRLIATKEPDFRDRMLTIVTKMVAINKTIDELVGEIFRIIKDEDGVLNRSKFIALPHSISLELLSFWLNENDCQFDSRRLHQLVVGCKTSSPGLKLDVDKNWVLKISSKQISLFRRSSV